MDGSEDEVVEAAAPEEMEEAAPKRATAEEISDIMSDLGGDVPLPEIGDDEEEELEEIEAVEEPAEEPAEEVAEEPACFLTNRNSPTLSEPRRSLHCSSSLPVV